MEAENRTRPRSPVLAGALAFLACALTAPAPASAACSAVYNVPADSATITGVLTAIPQNLGGDQCVFVSSGTYPEQVVIQNFNTNNFRIIISSAPGATVTVRPAGGYAAFSIKNASVTILGIDIKPTGAVSYGVAASSAGAVLSNVNVDSGGNIGSAGISITSGSSVSYSSITVQNAYGLLVTGSGSVVDFSTITNNSVAYAALSLNAASFNAITRSYMSNPSGRGASLLDAGYNTISQSAVVGDGSSGLLPAFDLQGAASVGNAITKSVISSLNNTALFIAYGADNSTVSQSTATSQAANHSGIKVTSVSSTTITQSYASSPNPTNSYGISVSFSSNVAIIQSTSSGGSFGLDVYTSSAVRVTNSYVQGGTAANVRSSTNTEIDSCVLASNANGGRGLWVDRGNVGLSLSSSGISGIPTATAIDLDSQNGANDGSLKFSSNTISGASIGFQIAAQAPGAVLSVSSLTFQNMATGASAINFVSGSFVSTFSGVHFADGSVATNVNGSGLAGGSRITMLASFGPRTGASYENDPSNRVDWTGGLLTLTVGAPANGLIESADLNIKCGGAFTQCSANYGPGSFVVLTATGNPTYTLSGWVGACAGVPSNTCNVYMDFDKFASADFYTGGGGSSTTLSISPMPSFGRVESSDLSIKCGGGYTQCWASYSSGTMVSLTAIADAGYSLGDWTGVCGGISTNTCNVFLDYSKSASANFYTGGGGSSTTFSISPMPSFGRVESADLSIKCGGGYTQCSASFAPYTSVSLTAIADGGYSLGGWTGVCAGNYGGSCYVYMDYSKSASADFYTGGGGSSTTLSISPMPSFGRVESSDLKIKCGGGYTQCSASFAPYTNVSLTATPDATYSLGNWTGVCAGNYGNNCYVYMDYSKSASADFYTGAFASSVTFSISPMPSFGRVESSDLSIKCGGGYTQCWANYSSGTVVMLTATPDASYSLGDWTGVCGGISTNTCNVFLDYSKSASADFYTGGGGSSVTFSISPMPSFGRVESSDLKIKCGGGYTQCSASFAPYASVSLTATPDATYSLGSWTGVCAGNYGNNCYVYMDYSKSASADFYTGAFASSVTFSISPMPSFGRVESSDLSIKCGGGYTQCSASFAPYTSVSLTAIADGGYSLGGWTGVCAGNYGGSCYVYMDYSKSASADFYTGGGGSGTTLSISPMPSFGRVESSDLSIKCGGGYTQCSASYSTGTVVMLTATPDGGYSLGNWTGVCGGIFGTVCNAYMDYSKSASADFYTGAAVSSVTLSIMPMPSFGRVESADLKIKCGGGYTKCSATYDLNANVSLTAIADGGYSLTNWTGVCGWIGGSSCSVMMSVNQSASAYFGAGGGGLVGLSISPVPASGRIESADAQIKCGGGYTQCFGQYARDQLVTLTGVNDIGFTLKSWGGACSGSIGNSCHVSMTFEKFASAAFAGLSTLNHLELFPAPYLALAGQCSPSFTLRTFGSTAPVSVAQNTDFVLTSNPVGLDFHALPDCSGGTIPSVTIPAGQGEVSFYARSAGTGFYQVEASSLPAWGGTARSLSVEASTSASNQIFGSLAYQGAASSGSARVLLSPVSRAQVEFSTSVSVSGAMSYAFGSPPQDMYGLFAYLDRNDNLKLDIDEPVALPSGEFFHASGMDQRDLRLCDRALLRADGQSVPGALNGDCFYPADNANLKLYAFHGTQGQPVTIEMASTDFYPSLLLFDPNGNQAASSFGAASNVGIRGFVLPQDGVYTIAAAGQGNVTGSFQISMTQSLGQMGSIAGTAAYAGTQGGNILVGLYDSSSFDAVVPVRDVLAVNGAFSFLDLPAGRSYYAAAFPDINYNKVRDAGEDLGVYGGTTTPSFINVFAGQVTNVALTIAASGPATGAGSASGTVAYAGGRAGDLVVGFWSNRDFQGPPNYMTAPVACSAGASPCAYSINTLSPGAYFVGGFLDLNSNRFRDPDEPFGSYAVAPPIASTIYLAPSVSVPNIDFAMIDPGAISGGQISGGEGTASLSISSAPAGSVFTATVTFTAGPSGIQALGVVGFGVPPGFGFPQTYSVYSPGFVTMSSTATATFSALEYFGGSGMGVRVQAGQVLPGQQVRFVLHNAMASCVIASYKIAVVSARDGAAMPVELFAGSPSLSVKPGVASFVSLASNANFSILQDQFTSQSLLLRDACQHEAALSAEQGAKTVTIRAQTMDAGYQWTSDAGVGLSTSPIISTASLTTVDFGVGRSSRTFYIVGAAAGSNKRLELASDIAQSSTFYATFNVLPGNALSNVSVSSEPYSAGTSSMTLNPSALSGANAAYVRFTLGDPYAYWRVLVSSVPFAADREPMPVWESYYSLTSPPNIAVKWDGRYSPWINMGTIVPNGLYYARVEIGAAGAGIRHDGLTIRVSGTELKGKVIDAALTPPLPIANAEVSASRMTGFMSARSAQDGAYQLAGITPSATYFLSVRHPDYQEANFKVYIDSAGRPATISEPINVTASTDSLRRLVIAMNRPTMLVVVPPALVGYSTKPFAQEGSVFVTGSTSAVTGPAPQMLYGRLCLPASTTTWNDCGHYDFTTQDYVLSPVNAFQLPAGSYTVVASFPGFEPSSASVYVGASGATLSLPSFAGKSSISGLVTLPSNPAGTFVSINALPLSTSAYGGSTSIYLGPSVTQGAYTIGNLKANSYLMRANTPGLVAVTTGPIALPAATDKTGVDFPNFGAGAEIKGSVTVSADTSLFPVLDGSGAKLRLFVNAWAPGSFSMGSTMVVVAAGLNQTASYAIGGLDAGATYQVYASLEHQGDKNFTVAGGLPILKAAGAPNLDFSFAASSGVIAGTLILPANSTDFLNVDLFGQTVDSGRATDVGETFSVLGSTRLPGFACTADNSGAASGYCPAGNSSATFRVEGLNTQTNDFSVRYRTTGQIRKTRVSVADGAVTPALINLAAQTFSLSGAVINQVGSEFFNTSAKVFANAPEEPLLDKSGAPVAIDPAGVARSTASLARVVAVRQEISGYGQALQAAFDPLNSHVGYLTQAGTFTIRNVPPGVYFVRTADLRACSTCEIAVPSVGRTVRVTDGDVSAVSLTMSDGFSVGGTISLDGGISDSRILSLTVLNKRQEVVRSTTVYLGNLDLGVKANSVDYAFSNLPANDFYTLTVKGLIYPVKYVGKPLKFPDPSLSPNGLQSDLRDQDIVMQRAAYMVGKLRDAGAGELISSGNIGLLPSNFRISATANPWEDGGFVVAASSLSGRPLEFDSLGDVVFRVGPLPPNLSYDLKLGQTSWDPSSLLQGSRNYAPVSLGGLRVQPGELKDVGVIDLNQGQSIGGTLRESTTSGVLLGNIQITAKPSFNGSDVQVKTYTDAQGRYTLWASTYISKQFDITAAPRGGNTASNGAVYGEVTRRNVNLVAGATADFLLEPLSVSVTGQVVVADSAQGGALSYPFGDKKGFPAAAINLQLKGTVPMVNPLGDIEVVTDEQDRFEAAGLRAGVYLLKASSLGYDVFKATVTVTASGFRIYTGADVPGNVLPGNVLTLSRAAMVTGRILKSDGSAPNDSEVGGIVAANFAQKEFVLGTVEFDPNAKTVNSYTLSGFKPGLSYDIVILPREKGDDVNFPPEGDGIAFRADESSATKNVNLTYLPAAFDCVPTSKKALGNNQFQIRIDCTKPLRGQLPSDSDLDQVLTVSSVTSAGALLASPDGTGDLLGADKSLSGNRRRITAIYRAKTLEVSFSLRVRAFGSNVNPETGDNFFLDKVFDFYVGLDANAVKKLNNVDGGSVELEPTAEDEENGLGERAKIDVEAGTFAEGDDDATAVVVASKTVNLGISKGRDQRLARSLSVAALGYEPAGLEALGRPGAFPPEMAAAMRAYRGLASTSTIGGANPLSSFYSIFLPAGIRHQLKQRADLTLSYNTLLSSATIPDSINVWFYNATLGRYVLENTDRRLDTVNRTITVGVDHFSTFVVLDSTPVASSTVTFSGADIVVANFPNPADCIVHSNIQRNSTLFGSGGTHAPFSGTMIRASLPAGGSENLKFNIYNVAGERVRTIEQGTVAGGMTHYTPWNCANDEGRIVASGVYVGEAVWGGKRKHFKIAIIKGSGL